MAAKFEQQEAQDKMLDGCKTKRKRAFCRGHGRFLRAPYGKLSLT